VCVCVDEQVADRYKKITCVVPPAQNASAVTFAFVMGFAGIPFHLTTSVFSLEPY
jgi:hypothetical protein